MGLSVDTINTFIDLAQGAVVDQNKKWSEEQKARVNLFIDNAQKIFQGVTDDIDNEDQFMELLDDLNQAFADSDWLTAGK